MSLSYNIDKLLGKDEVNDVIDVTDVKVDEELSNQSFSDNEDLSDDDKSVNTPYIRKYTRRQKPNVPEDVRLRVNGRERQRMHDLNSALDSLRQTLPYSHGPSVKKISKMATLVLARNYIVMLNKSLDEMKKLVTEMSMKQTQPTSVPATPAVTSERLSSAAVPTMTVPSITPIAPYSTHAHGTSGSWQPTSSTNIHKHISAYPYMHPFYMPYKLSPVPTSHIHGSISPLCPCNFCQVSLASLPKPDWKQAC